MSFVRRAQECDIVRLAEIEVMSYRLNFYPIFRTDKYFFSELTVPALIDEYERLPQKLENSFVYFDGVVKGFIRINGEEIEKLFVEPAFTGCGIGGALLDYALENTKASRLLVLEKNVRGRRFYEQHGFFDTGKRQRVDDTNEMFIVMRKKTVMPYKQGYKG